MPGPFSKGSSSRGGGDDWYIPYRPNAHGPNYSQGIGGGPASSQPKSSSSAQILRAFSSRPRRTPQAPYEHARPGELDKGYEFPSREGGSSDHGPGTTSRFQHASPALTALHPSPSFDSLADARHGGMARLPSSASVPSGLSGPKILYSPMTRELRAQHQHLVQSATAHHQFPVPLEAPRQRTTSAPSSTFRPRPAQQTHRPRASRGENRGWAPSTMCDLLVFPRPSLRPHSFSPPPEMPAPPPLSEAEGAVKDGERRQRERETWHDYAQRARSMSFGSDGARAAMTGGGPALPVMTEKQRRSNSLARSRSSGSRRHAGSVKSKPSLSRTTPGIFGRRGLGYSDAIRSSFGARIRRRPSEDPNATSSTTPLTAAPRRRASHGAVGAGSASSAVATDGKVKRRSRSVSHARPAGGALDMADYPPIPPRRSSRIVQVREAPQMDKNGVVIISRSEDAAAGEAAGAMGGRRSREGSDRSKPLPMPPIDPDVPAVAVLDIPAQAPHAYTSFTDAGSSDLPPHSHVQPSSMLSMSRESVVRAASGGSAHARTYLNKQHQRAQTRKAFQAPAAPLSARTRLAAQPPAPRLQRESVVSRYSQDSAPASAGLPVAFQRRQSSAASKASRNRAASVGELQGAPSHGAPWHARHSTASASAASLAPRDRTVSAESQGSMSTAQRYSRPPTPLSPALPHPLELAPPIPTRSAVWDSPPRQTGAGAQQSMPAQILQPTAIRAQGGIRPEAPATPAPVASTLSDPLTKAAPTAATSLTVTPRSLRPELAHTDTSVSKTTIYTDASEGWDRSQQPTPTPAPAQLPDLDPPSPPASASPGGRASMDEPTFPGLFFRIPRTPNDRSAFFSTASYPSRADTEESGSMPHARNEPFLGLGFYQDRSRAPLAHLQLEHEQALRRDSLGKSSSGGSTIEVITPALNQEPHFRQVAMAHHLEAFGSKDGGGARTLAPALEDDTQRDAPQDVPSAIDDVSNRISALISTPSTAGTTPALCHTPSMHRDTPVRYSRVRSGYGAVASDGEEEISPRRQSHVPLFELSGSESPSGGSVSPEDTFGLRVAADSEMREASSQLATPAQHGRTLTALTEVATPVSPYSQTSFRHSMIDAFPTPPREPGDHRPHSSQSEDYETDYNDSVHKQTSFLRMNSEDTTIEGA